MEKGTFGKKVGNPRSHVKLHCTLAVANIQYKTGQYKNKNIDL